MKKIIALVLLAVMLLGLTACGTINKTEVSILWSDLEYDADNNIIMVPNSLINAMERAMYIESISYKHYDGNADSANQIQQAKTSVDNGCSGLMVQLADPAAAQQIIDIAKGKNIPVVFFGCDVAADVISGYEKCSAIKTDLATVSTVQGEMIGAYLENEKDAKALDVNEDGKITYMALGEIAATVERANAYLNEKAEELKEKGKKAKDIPALEAGTAASMEELTVSTVTKKKTEYGLLTAADGSPVELIIADNDQAVLEAMVVLQGLGFNKDKLTTHCVGIFAVDCDADYKALVLSCKPEGEEAIKAYYEEQRYLVDLTSVKEEELNEMVYNTMNVIDAGQILNTAMEDYDAMAEQGAALMAGLLKGKAAAELYVEIPYKPYQ